MATLQTVKGADFQANAIGFEPPVTSGLQGWFYIGNSAALSVKDLSFTADALVVGTPTYSTGYATCTSLTNYLQTSVAETAEGTILAVAKWPSGQTTLGSGIISSAVDGSPQAGVEQYIGTISEPTASLNHYIGKTEITNPVFTALAANAIQTRAFYAASWSQANTSLAVYNKTANTSSSTTFSGTRSLSGVPFRLGSSYNTRSGTIELSFWAYYNRVLTADEITSIYTFVAAYMLAKRSLTI